MYEITQCQSVKLKINALKKKSLLVPNQVIWIYVIYSSSLDHDPGDQVLLLSGPPEGR